MCEEITSLLKQLMDELGVTQADIAKQLSRSAAYNVNPSEMSRYMHGENTPKAKRVRKDALDMLLKERDEQQGLIARAREA